jgi:hypothetical protein
MSPRDDTSRYGATPASTYDPPTVPAGTAPGSYRRSPVDATRLWAGGLATAIVAALTALVGVLVVRAVLRIAVYSPAGAGVVGDSSTLTLCVVAAGAALAATGLVHLLLLATPSPLSYFGWIVGLLTAAAVVTPILEITPLPIALAQSVIHLVVGLAIGSLVSGAAVSAMRVARQRTCPP